MILARPSHLTIRRARSRAVLLSPSPRFLAITRSALIATMASPESRPTAAMPPMIYGTAWKKERTADLVYEAIKAGFRGIDTAAMTKHYDEAGAGQGIRRAIREGIVTRRELYIQTKFTPLDPSSPYDPSDPIAAQIHASLASSLANLAEDGRQDEAYLDAYLLHSPFPRGSQTLEAWSALQSYLPASSDPARRGRVLRLGISNAPLDVLESLHPAPSVVQNPLYGGPGPRGRWDRAVRAWCRRGSSSSSSGGGGGDSQQADASASEGEVKYQGFWTLTANAAVWSPPRGEWFVVEVANGAGVSRPGAWYALLMEKGVVVLNGTTSPERMREDLEVKEKVERWKETKEGRDAWERCWKGLEEFLEQRRGSQ
ncbi:hypothetical protein VTJ83DRAFT_6758 [Remersonia thermophila]|uniref:NADP-dependent oxidoreductase domain-containing protein n=1 Tax=Remersonia thermophila TaxID=72144 RepID=A0ABR4D5M2_9PEZI